MVNKEMRVGAVRTTEQGHAIEVEIQIEAERYQIYFRGCFGTCSSSRYENWM
jgi:hypothetical protein